MVCSRNRSSDQNVTAPPPEPAHGRLPGDDVQLEAARRVRELQHVPDSDLGHLHHVEHLHLRGIAAASQPGRVPTSHLATGGGRVGQGAAGVSVPDARRPIGDMATPEPSQTRPK